MVFGVDIGGTFTDLVIVDTERQQMYVGKCLTNPTDPARGVLDGLEQLIDQYGLSPQDIGSLRHATTLMTNALIERKGARTALITTRGFRDVLEIGRESRYQLYDLFLQLPEPLVSRPFRLEVLERIGARGDILAPLDSAALRSLADTLVAQGVEAVAVSFIHAYANPVHEEAAALVLAEAQPGLYLSISSRVAPEIREYERTSSTVVNAYVRPAADRYLTRLSRGLAEAQCTGDIYPMLSSGGVCTVDVAREFPIRLVESGPAAGALVGGFYGRMSGHPDVVAFDMGGTTAKACLIEGGQPRTTFDFEVARVHRFMKGSGLPIKIPTLDLIEIGAGGGSIARVDSMGLLRVGPESAGAEPGPACYGRGGREPTVTDADLVLGYLNAGYFLGGTMNLDSEAAETALRERICRPLGLSLTEAAWGIHEVVNENMASAIRIHIAEHGQDPRRYALVATGGAGPVHVVRLARKLHIQKVICPLAAGVASTIGMLVTPPRFELFRSYFVGLSAIDWERLNAMFQSMEREATAAIAQAGVRQPEITYRRFVDARYVGQGYEIAVQVPYGRLGPESLSELMAAFAQAYEERFGRTVHGVDVEGLTWRLVAVGQEPDLSFLSRRFVADGAKAAGSGASPGELDPVKGSRNVIFGPNDGQTSLVYDRYRLRRGMSYRGPAVIEEQESTVVVSPDARFEVDAQFALVVELED